ncbi:hypothetical protein [Robertmurraya massiliosenegalensis]|uniref:hypothetical protein n=1 Tax=Robertmurraya massiliosenegalensis TaxID=1287657 RepID=UPI00031F629C|nr:hypothetical protein [Robertmurraya massiliosenegalensis]
MNKREIDFKTTETLQSAEIKAALYAGGNLSKLVRNAVATYTEGFPYETVNRVLELNVMGYKISVQNVPHFLIQETVNENIVLSSTLERIIEQRIKTAIAESEFIPKEISTDFEDFLVPDFKL